MEAQNLLIEESGALEFDTKFYMKEITVDGVKTRRSHHLYTNPMFTLKQEENEQGEITDTGKPMHYNPNVIIDEDHWIKCGHLIDKAVGEICPKCQSTKVVDW